ncbi:MAG: hypothetical protein WCG27_05710 [Pseudomonadota bacterium]
MSQEIGKLSNQQLLDQTVLAVKNEKALTGVVLKHLQEIEKRRLHCELGYSSLFAYCVGHLGYSESESKCRISAMRFMKGSETIAMAISKGEVPLTTISLLGDYCNREKKKNGSPVTLPEREKLLDEVKGKSTRQVECQLFSLDPSKKIKLELDEESMALMDKFRQLKGSHGDLEIIKIALKKTIQAIEDENNKRMKKVIKTVLASATPPDFSLSPATVKKSTRYLPQKIKDHAWIRAQGQCEFKTKDGKRCDEKRGLEYHHCRPFGWGALHDKDNIALLCKGHNQLAAIRDFGQQKMDFYLTNFLKS